MKEHGSKLPAEVPPRTLKSLLKKPGQSKTRAQKNRVVINEKLNEFFAADYIILIKEECCADYEEDCDCCCQEHEMIRLGNCKECRAELNLHFAAGNGRLDRDEESDNARGGVRMFGCEEPREDEEEDDEVDEDEEEEEEEDEEPVDEVDHREERVAAVSPIRQHQSQETLSPPEGYKDVCDEGDLSNSSERHLHPACTECNYYHQRTTELEEHAKVNGNDEETRNSLEPAQHVEEKSLQQEANDQAPQTKPDIHQRYLVETITMTTVTERRIVREISSEETRAEDQESERRLNDAVKDDEPGGKDEPSGVERNDAEVRAEDESNETERGQLDASELSLTFKLGGVSSLVSNSLKPNSAVRQLFPDPRFISPPPAPASKAILNHQDEVDLGNMTESQRFLVTQDSLRLFDAKRGKIGRTDSSESEPGTIKRTIERNALRRSLIGKYDTITRKKNLRSKDLSLEERIRQLTCVDQDDDNPDSSIAENASVQEEQEHNAAEFPVRTSPSGEESVTRNVPVGTLGNESHDHHDSTNSLASGKNGNGQSTYRKLTDLFGQKKNPAEGNLPDIGLGNNPTGRSTLGKDYQKNAIAKMNSDVRRQFLASLAPLSCVTSNSAEGRDDYYRITSRIAAGGVGSRDSIGYNSDSSYSLEDIDAVLNGGEERQFVGPPDVTRGTPTGTGPPDSTDNTADELLAFVEQDRTRTERLRRRYEADDRYDDSSGKPNGELARSTSVSNDDKSSVANEEDEDDELNDYGFNRRPSVRGIKPQFGTTDEIVKQLRTRSLPPNSYVDIRASFHASWPAYYEKNGEQADEKLPEDTVSNNATDNYATLGKDDRDTNTINRINTMQKQIDDIYQTIAETAVNVQGAYLDTTLPRPLVSPLVRIPTTDGTANRYTDPKTEQLHFDHQNQRILRIAGEDGTATGYANTLPKQAARRHPAATVANYHCNILPGTVANAKCYRTMYFVPYDGITDPTYQNIQRILPPHSSPSYATHIERYPYPRPRADQPQQQQQPVLQPQQPTRYYTRPIAPTANIAATQATLASQQTLHLHLHHHQPEDFRLATLPNNPHPGVHPLQLQHHQHHHQLGPYHVQSALPAGAGYSVVAPARCASAVAPVPPNAQGYHLYQVHLGRGAADVQTQTISTLNTTVQSNTCGTLLTTAFNGNVQSVVGAASSSSSSSSPALSSPTKSLQHNQQRGSTCNVAERGVPEGAASAPAHDFTTQTGSISTIAATTNTYVTVPPQSANAQNSVYYAMNV